MSPNREYIKRLKKLLKTGDNLSQQDIGVLALALNLNAILYTDDYGIQNVAKN